MPTSVKPAIRSTTTERLNRLRLQVMASEMASRVGERMRTRREELGLKQRDVADRIDDPAVSNQHVSNWERGVYEPSDRYRAKIVQALEVNDWSYFVTVEDPTAPTPDLMTALNNGQDITELFLSFTATVERLERKIDELTARIEESPPGAATG